METIGAPPRRLSPRRAAAALVAVVLVAGCAAATTPSPSASAASPTPAGSSVPPTIVPSAVPSATPVVTPCPVSPVQGVALPSDRLVQAYSWTIGPMTRITFALGDPSGRTPGKPSVDVGLVSPPFSQDASGAPISVSGDRVIRVRFSGMWLYDDKGTPTLTGERRVDQDGTVRTLVNAGEFEGVSTWLIGFDGPGCVVTRVETNGSFVVEIVPPGS